MFLRPGRRESGRHRGMAGADVKPFPLRRRAPPQMPGSSLCESAVVIAAVHSPANTISSPCPVPPQKSPRSFSAPSIIGTSRRAKRCALPLIATSWDGSLCPTLRRHREPAKRETLGLRVTGCSEGRRILSIRSHQHTQQAFHREISRHRHRRPKPPSRPRDLRHSRLATREDTSMAS